MTIKVKICGIKSINHADAMEELKSDNDKKDSNDCKPLLKKIKVVLGDVIFAAPA